MSQENGVLGPFTLLMQLEVLSCLWLTCQTLQGLSRVAIRG